MSWWDCSTDYAILVVVMAHIMGVVDVAIMAMYMW